MLKEHFLTFVINLKESTDRKIYMENLLASFDFLDVVFVEAIDGRIMTKEEISLEFDESLALKRYGRSLGRGEIGCTLSHYKCYKKLLESDKQYALILEDDITLIKDVSIIKHLISIVDVNLPVCLLLSGDYWMYRKKKVFNDFFCVDVFDAVGAYAYIINRTAASLLLKANECPGCVSDSWYLSRKQGVKLKAIYPYLIDANIESFQSTIKQTYFGQCRKNMPWNLKLFSYWEGIVKRIILLNGGFVSKIRKKQID